ncbi:MAG: preprotein translocase subunit YajC [Eubacteriales bacterium]|nr:preprotein translocase subunit YajC [Eubacteriales bacterium]
MDQMTALLPLILLIFIMYFLLIRPQKKREKAVSAMRNAVRVGDEVITIGGIRGKVIKSKDEVLTIQVGSDKVKFDVMRWAISSVNGKDSAPSPAEKVVKDEESAKESQPAPKKLPKRMNRANEAPLDEMKMENAAEVKTEASAPASADIITDEIEK